MDDFQKYLIDEFGKENVFKDEPMSIHTTFRIGGNADYFVTPNIEDERKIADVIRYCRDNKINYFVLGNGSNIVVRDEGIRGLVLSLKHFDKYEIKEDKVIVGAGVLIARLSKIFLENSLSGLEFACGIPGTVGGAIFMNAGAYGGETKDVIIDVTYLDLDSLAVKTITNEECKFEYRKSFFHSINAIILSATFKKISGSSDEIKAKMDENMVSRNAKQPVNLPCAGSIFRREEGVIVAKLIDEAGLKGFSIGGAQVSTLHAGFIVNTGNATAKDVLDLIEHIKKVILEKYNVELHEEIRVI